MNLNQSCSLKKFQLSTVIRVSFIASSLLISLCLFLIMMTSREISEFREQTLDDLKEWKVGQTFYLPAPGQKSFPVLLRRRVE